MPWLVTGGAGYIGGHVLLAMREAGLAAVVIDDLSTGDIGRLPPDTPIVVASVLDAEAMRGVLHDHSVDGVIHLAAKKSVEASVEDPLLYYRENLVGTLTVLSSMAQAGVRRLVLSSSAAVYGTPATDSGDEDAPTRPESPYGRTKLVSEWMVHDAARALGFSCLSLRYFNVTGCADPRLGDNEGSNLFPQVLRALVSGDRPVLFGDDYPTRDGSCLRDYIHVQDLAEAHVAAARLVTETRCDETVNIGCGTGHTVREVLAAMAETTGFDTTPRVLPRRPGDPAGVVATVERAERLLHWTARFGLDDMVSSAWSAMNHDSPANEELDGRALESGVERRAL